MYRLFLYGFFLTTLLESVCATGVAVVDATKGIFLRLDTSTVSVKVDGQIARTTATFVFKNTDTADADIVFVFPLPASASVTELRFRIGRSWSKAALVAQSQDTTVPTSGPSVDPKFSTYIGAVPLFFDLPGIVRPDSLISVELQYVQLLPYELGVVEYIYPADYLAIQPTPVASASFALLLESQREIDSLLLTSHTASSETIALHSASLTHEQLNGKLDRNYRVRYRLNTGDLGLFGYSTLLDSVCDGRPKGVLLFIVEPDASESSATIEKTFTLVIDRSGSMGGSKIAQARDAASFIINSLNIGDQFNLIDFDSKITSFRPTHVPYNATTRSEALAFIATLYSSGGTNIHGALTTALDQFPPKDPSRTSIIIFFTDGQASTGITSDDGICNAVKQLNSGKDIILFSFGIGNDVNRRLLTRLADENNGVASFLDAKDLYSEIANFYLKVRSPVLLEPKVRFSPPVVDEVYPQKLPNLYKGQQLLISGRYAQAVNPLSITLEGLADGKPVTYTYSVKLADSTVPEYAFLPKVWAKMKIEDLLVNYHIVPEGSSLQDSLKDEVVSTSLCFGVASPFTSFQVRWNDNLGQDTTGGGGNTGDVESQGSSTQALQTIIAYPNPFIKTVTISIYVADHTYETTTLHIYDIQGKLVRSLPLTITGSEVYQMQWDGKDDTGADLPSGTYICVVTTEVGVYSGRIIKR